VFLYNCARSFVFPSWFEGFGFPPLEAQACGVPVLSSNRTSLAEILEQSAILFDPWNVSALADALMTIESDSKLRENVVRVGYENIKRFSWTTAAHKTLESFKQAL
jgi:glycosyltransferase involved in cell wall biosynthesis